MILRQLMCVWMCAKNAIIVDGSGSYRQSFSKLLGWLCIKSTIDVFFELVCKERHFLQKLCYETSNCCNSNFNFLIFQIVKIFGFFKVEDEMSRLRSQLRVKLKRRTFLRRMLGVSKVEAFLRNNFQQVKCQLSSFATHKTKWVTS